VTLASWPETLVTDTAAVLVALKGDCAMMYWPGGGSALVAAIARVVADDVIVWMKPPPASTVNDDPVVSGDAASVAGEESKVANCTVEPGSNPVPVAWTLVPDGPWTGARLIAGSASTVSGLVAFLAPWVIDIVRKPVVAVAVSVTVPERSPDASTVNDDEAI
jgi:hypothetical protein